MADTPNQSQSNQDETRDLQQRAHEQLTAQELEEIRKQGQPLTETLLQEILERRNK